MNREKLIVLDFGDPSAITAARMIRGANVYCEIMRFDAPAGKIKERAPSGIVAVGGVQDADSPGSPAFNPEILELGVPVLALGYGARALCAAEGGRLDGRLLESQVKEIKFPETPLFREIEHGRWFVSRADRMLLPKGYQVISAVEGAVIAMKKEDRECYAVQLVPEQNDMDCVTLISNFAVSVCGCKPVWTLKTFIDESVAAIRALVGSGTALVPLSGGVDSSVCAALMHRAIGNRLHCIFVDTGLMRKNESESVQSLFAERMKIGVNLCDGSERFYGRLKGVTDSAMKKSAVEKELRAILAEEAAKIGGIDFFASGLIYRDTVDAENTVDYAGGALKNSGIKYVIEPLRELFKDEVRGVGEILGLPDEIIRRQPFPESGLAIRCLGEVTPEKLKILREADAIFREEIKKSAIKSIWQYFAVLTGGMSKGFTPLGKFDGHVIALRAVSSADSAHSSIARLSYDLLAAITDRITREVPGVSRVVYDITGKPPAAVEWE